MARHSNSVSHTSVDGLPSNPFPERAVYTRCICCNEKIADEICPHCGTINEIEYEPDYTAGEKEYDKYDDV